MASYHIWTIGCQMNKAESARLADRMEGMGYISARRIEEADIVVLNSCVVREAAENRVLSKLESLSPVKRHRPEMTVALAGCFVDSEVAELERRFPHVDLFLRPGEFAALEDSARSRLRQRAAKRSASPMPPTAFVTIIEGCDNFCSYCIVPYRRGRERSRQIDEIHAQVEDLVGRGVKEVTLLGQNVDSYGHDLPEAPDLAHLLQELSPIRGLERIRFLTSHPKDMSLRLIQAVSSIDKVCELVSLPVQAGDDDILKAMGRCYTVEHYRRLVDLMRREIPGVALSTDVIVGFPGETEERFQRTLSLLSDLEFDGVHVAAYSPRSGTQASRVLEDDVPLTVKRRRLQAVEGLQRDIASAINSKLLGHTLEVLVECDKQGKWQGRTRTGKLVFFKHEADCLGQLVDVEIQKTSPWSLQGAVRRTARTSGDGV